MNILHVLLLQCISQLLVTDSRIIPGSEDMGVTRGTVYTTPLLASLLLAEGGGGGGA